MRIPSRNVAMPTVLTGINALHLKQKKSEHERQNILNIQSKFESHFAHKSTITRLSITILQGGIKLRFSCRGSYNLVGEGRVKNRLLFRTRVLAQTTAMMLPRTQEPDCWGSEPQLCGTLGYTTPSLSLLICKMGLIIEATSWDYYETKWLIAILDYY